MTRAGSDQRAIAFGLVATAILAVQLGAALATELIERTGFEFAVALRLLLAVPVMLVIWPIRRIGWSRERLWAAIGLGVAVGGMNFFFFGAIERIPLGLAVALEFIGPLTVAALGAGRRLGLVWVALAAAGVALITDPVGEGSIDATGMAFALIAGAFWGSYILFAERVGRLFSEGSGLSVAMVVAAALTVPVGAIGGIGDIDLLEVLALGLGVALLASVITYGAELAALRRIRAGTFGVLLSLEPGVAALIGFAILGQGLGAAEVAGIALVTAAGAGALSIAPDQVAARQ